VENVISKKNPKGSITNSDLELAADVFAVGIILDQVPVIKHHSLVEISIQQLEEGFCGNLLQVLGNKGETITVLSSTAFNSLSSEQKETLSKHGKLIPIPIPVIEAVGGGSIRCMMAEIFCPRKTG
jgi:hypothetical protein